MVLRSVAGLLAAVLALTVPLAARAQVVAAHVEQGDLRGVRQGTVGAFLGVPFASPPVGASRWKPPVPAASWSGERRADAFSASCRQRVNPDGFGPWTREYVVTGAVSEDCLYLNVWTPARTAGERLPAMVWIHGGAFTEGSGAVPIYDGRALAAQGIVVVTVNYRLGVYGFLAHPELTSESPAHASGNYGLLDQVAALEWVRANIAAFGGDPARVTIAGQSAGAAAVHHLIASRLARGLFAQAIAQSGSGMGLPVPPLSAAEDGGARLGTLAGGKALAELRAMDAAELDALMQASPALRFGPVLDGLVLQPGATGSDVPLLTGMTANEMTGLNPNFGKATADGIRADLARSYGPLAPELAAAYAVDRDPNQAADALARDRGLASMHAWASERMKTAGQPIYAYLWTHAEPGPEAERYRAFHSSEIPYVFGTLDASPERPFSPVDRTLSQLAMAYWVSFVRTGDPNGTGRARWPRLEAAAPQVLVLGQLTGARPLMPDERLSLFGRHLAAGGTLGLF